MSRLRSLQCAFASLLILPILIIALFSHNHPQPWRNLNRLAGPNVRNQPTQTSSGEDSVKARLLSASLDSDQKTPDTSGLSQTGTTTAGNSSRFSETGFVAGQPSPLSDDESFEASFFPKRQQDALYRSRDRLAADKPFWQSVDDDMGVLTYAAHYDDVGTSPVIRVVGVARVPLPYDLVTCRYHGCLRCPVMHSVYGSVAHFRNRNGRRYIGAFVLCRLPRNHDVILPFAVSLRKERQTSGSRPILIHYSNATLARQSAHVQQLLHHHRIALKDGDVGVFGALWKHVRHSGTDGSGRSLEDGVTELDLRLRGDGAETKHDSEDGQTSAARSTDHEVDGLEGENGIDQENLTMHGTKENHTHSIDSTNTEINTREPRENGSIQVQETLNPSLKPRHGGSSDGAINIDNDLNTLSDLNTFSDLNTDNDLNSLNPHAGRSEAGYQWNVTRCFPAFQNAYNQHVLLAEMVAASRALGVDHFVFYVESVGPQVSATLKILESQGVAEVLPWNLHLKEKDLFYKGQFPAIQDCLYRQLRSSRYVLTGDVDELFVPHAPRHTSLVTLLDFWFHKRPRCGSFQFRNTFFNVQLPFPPLPPPPPPPPPPPVASKQHPNATTNTCTTTTTTTNNNNITISTTNTTSDIDALARQYGLPMYLHIERQILAMRPGIRSKIAMDPRRVQVGSVHIVEKLRRGFQSCVLNSKEGLLHHYRSLLGTAKVPVMDDPSVRRYGKSYVPEVVRLLEEVNTSKNILL